LELERSILRQLTVCPKLLSFVSLSFELSKVAVYFKDVEEIALCFEREDSFIVLKRAGAKFLFSFLIILEVLPYFLIKEAVIGELALD